MQPAYKFVKSLYFLEFHGVGNRLNAMAFNRLHNTIFTETCGTKAHAAKAAHSGNALRLSLAEA